MLLLLRGKLTMRELAVDKPFPEPSNEDFSDFSKFKDTVKILFDYGILSVSANNQLIAANPQELLFKKFQEMKELASKSFTENEMEKADF